MSAETSTSTIETRPSPELQEVLAVGGIVADVCRYQGFDPPVVDTFQDQVLDGLSVNLDESAEQAHFYDQGYIEQGQPDGRYELVLSPKVVEARKERLEGLVPAGTAGHLGRIWIIAHELGHGMQSAYQLAHQGITKEGIFAGLPKFKTPAEIYLEAHPEASMAEDADDSRLIESERQAEGIANLVLVDALRAMGMDEAQAERTVEAAGRPNRQKVQDQPTPHNVGYAHPLGKNELEARFAA